jgi:DNA-binding transcriptional ArsR family regulator
MTRGVSRDVSRDVTGDVAAAIADPVRREILALLRSDPLPAGVIASRFAISRPAVSRHLRVLRESGLVVDRAQGRERVYRLDVTPLAELDAWLAQFRGLGGLGGLGIGAGAAQWGARLDALETEVHRARRDREKGRSAGSETSDTPDTGEKTA